MKIKEYKKFIWSKKVMGSVVVAGALVGAGVFGLNGYFGGGEKGVPEDTMTRGLVAYYSFDEGSGTTAYDASDNSNDGTLTNGVKYTEGKKNGALEFDGSNDYVNCGSDSSLNIADAITMSVWVKPAVDMEASGGWFIVYKKDERATSSGYGIWIVDGQLGVWINNATRQYNASLSVDTWIYITGTYEDGSLKIYENGELKSTHTDVTGSISTNAIDLIIGKEGPSYANYFDGAIDEVRIYNRALSAEEVRYHYNRGGPVAHWRFDEGEGSIAYDESSNNNDGTLHLGSSGNTATSTAWVTGKHGSAIDFDGTDDYVDCGSDSSLNITDAITIEAWMKPIVDGLRKKPITITGSGSQETNYQVKVDVTYDSDMQADFDDIRFADSDGATEIDHWRESYTPSTSAVFWVEVPTIPTGGTTIYMYYGNSTASSASSLANTFTSGSFTDTFADETKIDTGASSNIAVSGGEVKLTTSSSAYTTPVANSAIASREFNSTCSSDKAINDNTADQWLAVISAATTDWIKFAIADDTYTTPVSADASRTLSNDIASYGGQKAIDENTGTNWYGPLDSTTDWARFVIANDTYTTPATAYATCEYSTSYAASYLNDDLLTTQWMAKTSGATDDFIILGATTDAFTTPTSVTFSTEHAAGPATDAIDDDIATNWYGSTSGSTTDWLKFDMGSIQNISGIKIYEDVAQTAMIEVSTNDSSWTTKETGVTLTANKWTYFWWGSSEIRYIKVNITDPGGTHAQIVEFDALVTTGATVSTDGCRIMQGEASYNTETVKIEATNDDENWTTLYSGAGLIGEQWKYFNWAGQNTRFIRVSITDPGSYYPRIQEFDYRKTSDNVGNVSVKGIRIWAGKNHTINIAYSTTDDEDASYTNLKTGVVLAGTYGWNYYAWTAQDLKYIRVSVTALGGESYPKIFEFDYRTGDQIVGTDGCRIYGDYGNDTVTISISTTDYEDSAFSSVLTGQTVIDGQWNEFGWSGQDTKYIKVAITATTEYPAMAEFDAKQTTYYLSGSLISVTIPENTSTRLAVGTQLSWNDTEPTNTDVKYQLQYYNGTWQLIPDADLSDNSTGFDTSPKDISSVKTSYGQIRLKGNLSTTSASISPSVQDWTVTHYYRKYASPEPTATVGAGATTGISKAGAYAIGANTTTAFVSINDQTISGTISSGWNHIALTYDKDAGGTQEMKLFANGIKLSTNDYSTAITSNSSNLFIGDLAGFNGSIDDVRIYDYARSSDEIRLDYNAGFAAMFGSSGKTCSEDPASCMDNGLVASYDFDEGDGQTLYNAADTGSANDGTLMNNPSWTTGAPAGDSPSSALDFDGTDDYVDCGNDSSLDITDAITIEAWVKLSVAEQKIIVDKNGYATGYYFRVADTTGKVMLKIDDGANDFYVHSVIDITDNAWHHIVGVINGRVSAAFYTDGVEGHTTTGTLANVGDISNNEILVIGARSNGTNLFNGSIDGVKIYNRACSAEEIRYHYNRGGPIGHWKFDEGTGSTAYDSTDNNNDGTLHLGSSGNTATSSAWVAGKHGSAIDFDGTDDYVDCGNDSSLDITDAITVEAWVKPIVDGLTKKPITITGSGSQETNYQVKVDVTYDSGMQADFDDIRFADSDGATEIDHWRESYTLSTSAVFWVEVPTIPTGGTTIYMYYGNSSASSASNGTNTFEFFDDFEGASLDTDKWDEEATPSVSIGSSILTLETNAVNEDIKSKTYTANGYSSSVAIRTKLKLSGSIPVDFGFGQSTIYENFTTFTEVDIAANRIQKTANHIDHLAYRNETTYVYKDYGVAYFGDFIHKVKIKFVSSSEAWSGSHTWLIANDIADAHWLELNNKTFISLFLLSGGSNNPIIILREMYLGGWNDDTYGCSFDTWYYIKLVKAGTDMKAYIYSDSDYSILVDTLAITLDANHTLRYLYGCNSDDWDLNRYIVTDIENFDLGVLSSTHCALSKYHSASKYCLAAEDGSNRETSAGITIETVDYHIREIVWTSAHVKLFKDGVEQKSLTNYHPNASLPIKLGNPEDTAVGTRTGYYDWVLVRKYASPEPTATVGAGATTGISKAGAYAIGANTTTAFVSINDQTISGTISSGWNHIALTYDKDAGGTQEMKLFANGIKLSTNDYSTAITSNSSNLFIGDLAGFNGSIDDVRIYNYARTPAQIQMDYNDGLATHFGGSNQSSVINEQCSSDPASCMDHGLVASYDFDEGDGQTLYNSADTGTANNGTLGSSASADSADPTYSSIINNNLSMTGPSGSALSFDGTNDYVDCGDSLELRFGTEDFTVGTWLKKETQTQTYDAVVTKGETGANEWILYFVSATQIRFYADGGNIDSGLITGANDGNWYHIVFTRSGDDGYFYIDGVEKSHITGIDNVDLSTTKKVSIGASQQGTDRYFNGSIDGVKIYNRALSAEEVRYHYNRGGPVAHWRFDEGEGSTLYDETSNNNDGTLGGGTEAHEPTWVEGKHGSALDFDGTDDYIDCGNDPSLNITDAITIEAWVKMANIVGNKGIVTDMGNDGNRGWWVWINNDEVVFGGSDDGSTAHLSYRYSTDANLVADNWYYIVVTKSGTDADFYLNGNLLSNNGATIYSSYYNASVNTKIGKYQGSAPFNGSIDDVRIYNYARTPAQIQMDYNAGFGTHLK